VTEKPRRFRRGKSESDTGSEPPHTSSTGSEEDPNIDRFFWKDGDLKVIYDPYAEERRKRGQRP
jgi:hypothetical protein